VIFSPGSRRTRRAGDGRPWAPQEHRPRKAPGYPGIAAGGRRSPLNSSIVRWPSHADAMKKSLEVTAVGGGYVAAFLVAYAAVAIRVANTRGPDAQAASGMFAFGDSVLFVAVFGVLALVPTGGALYFLRPYRRFWMVVSLLCLTVAATGLTAAILFAVGRQAAPSPLATWAGLSVLRILLAPLLALTFAVCALFTPHRSPRFAFLAAAAMEVVVTAYAGIVWFVPMLLHRR
jgi:hypothetical protein